ncbi:MAG: DUF3482 domain-containing protein [Burkholderiaceae bacterium]
MTSESERENENENDASAQTIALSLVSHTNVGKTTLARTLLGRDVGEVRDEAHVTERSDEYLLTQTPAGDRLMLWDTPGFGDSARLAQRLARSGDPIGWFLSEVWDRFRDRAFWSSQQAVRTVRERTDVVLYLVNAAETPEASTLVSSELRVLDWIGKPVIVLLNQLGRPRPAGDDAAEVERWRRALAGAASVRAVLPLDAFARCWVQEGTLLHAVARELPPGKRAACERLIDEWQRERRAVFEASISVLAERVARAALDREAVPEGGMLGRLKEVGQALASGSAGDALRSPARQTAMRRLAERLDDDIRSSTDRLIALHGLGGHASAEILTRLAEHYAVDEPVSEGRAAALGGALTGALAGLKADLATGGLSFGAGLLAGGIVGALGGFGLARGYNLVRGAQTPMVMWADAVLDELCASALLGYLAVAHYGRGRGDWTASESPPHWRSVVGEVLAQRQETLKQLWSLRGERDEAEGLESALRQILEEAAVDVLSSLYPQWEGHRRERGQEPPVG